VVIDVSEEKARWRPGDAHAVAGAPAWPEGEPLTVERCRAVFDEALPFTLGLEEELMLVEPRSLALAPVNDAVLALFDDEAPYRKELRATQLELITPVCATAAEAGAALAGTRARLVETLGGAVRLVGAGTHPTSTDWGSVSADERYQMLADEYEWATRRSVLCGLHVHVAVGGAERTLAVHNALRSYLPEIGALAANSPFAEGRDTGLCSIRAKLSEAFPRSGVPPAFATWQAYVGWLDWGRAGGLFPDSSHLWWDLRLHPTYGTVEIRVSDAQTRVDDNGAIAAVVQALVAWLALRHDAGEKLPIGDYFRIRENSWRALRHGVNGWLVDLETGERQATRERITALLDELEPVARELGADEQIREARVLVAGNGADRQRYVAEREGLDGLLRWLVTETEAPKLFDARRGALARPLHRPAPTT
jgi:glutamate---cysteine ligase / carboxylate-amine ligase